MRWFILYPLLERKLLSYSDFGLSDDIFIVFRLIFRNGWVVQMDFLNFGFTFGDLSTQFRHEKHVDDLYETEKKPFIGLGLKILIMSKNLVQR